MQFNCRVFSRVRLEGLYIVFIDGKRAIDYLRERGKKKKKMFFNANPLARRRCRCRPNVKLIRV